MEYNFKFTLFCDCGRLKDEPHNCFPQRLDEFIQQHPVTPPPTSSS